MANWEEIRREWQTSKITFKALAEKHGIKDSTIRSRKNREKWQRNDATQRTTKKQNVATKNKRTKKESSSNGQKNRSGNPNPSHKFPNHNSFQLKHGLYSKFLHAEQLEIIDAMDGLSVADQLWIQIEIKFSAIIRMQKIMWVEGPRDTLGDVSMQSNGSEGSMTGYKVAYAYEQYEAYIKAQARAMAEYRNLVKQFMDLAHDDDERRLKIELMQANINKAKAEADKISNKDDDKPIEIMIRRKGERS